MVCQKGPKTPSASGQDKLYFIKLPVPDDYDNSQTSNQKTPRRAGSVNSQDRDMADITMCKGENCPQKEKCHRFAAKKARRMQTFFRKTPVKDGECKHFWPMKDTDSWYKLP